MVDLLKSSYDFSDLVKIMTLLRAPGGCPWDTEQTHASIRKNFIEEVYEVCDAIDRSDMELMCEELGDVLLQVVFHSEMASERGDFDIDNVCDGICRKLIRRHPHIFADVKADDAKTVLDNWDSIKKAEKAQKSHSDTIADVPKTLPALMYAQKVQKRAAKAGFDWDSIDGALAKIDEEAVELRQAVEQKLSVDKVADELGDLIFAAVNAARFAGLDAEETLTAASAKFARRFSAIEQMAQGKLDQMTLSQMDELWDKVKLSEKQMK